jgi:hypothetical protein
MALSGSLNTNAYGSRYLTLSWTATQSIEKNESYISWTLKGAGGSGYYMAAPFTVVIDGETVYYSTTRIELYNGTTVASGKKTIKHNDDGTRTFKVDFSAAIYYFDVNVWNNTTFTLDTIPRASGVAATTGYIDSPITISISRHATSFTHTLFYAFGSASGTIATETGETSLSWTPPIELCKQIPSALQGACTITCDTYNGSTKIGSSTTSVNIAVPKWVQLEPDSNCGSVKPYNTGTAAENIAAFVQGYSKAEVTFIPENIGTSKAYGATPKSFYISFEGVNVNASPYRTGLINTAGAKQITCYVVDTRDRTTSFTLDFTALEYAPPTLSDVSLFRCDKNGIANDEGTYFAAKATAKYSELSGNNYVTFDIGYAVVGGTIDNDERKPMKSGETSILGDGYVSTQSTYLVEIRLIDRLNRGAIYTDFVPTEKVFLQGREGGNAAGFGKPPERDNVLDVAWDLQTRGDLYIGNKGHKVTDFVMELGEKTVGSALWQYRKWNTGRIEMWSRQDMESGAFSGENGFYYSSPINVPLPFALGSDKAVALVSIHSSGVTWAATAGAWAEDVRFVVGRMYGGIDSLSLAVQIYVSGYLRS